MTRLKAEHPFTEGVVLAPVFLYRPALLIPDAAAAEHGEGELERFRRAVEEVTEQLTARAERDDIAAAHLELIRDPSLQEQVFLQITEENKNAELALDHAIALFCRLFRDMKDTYMQAREADIKDIGNRLMRALKGVQENPFAALREKSIVVAEELMPSDTAQMDLRYVEGFLTQEGGSTSHIAIMARSRGIPALVGVSGLLDAVRDGDTVAFDASSGEIVLNPSPEAQDCFRRRRQKYLEKREAQRNIAQLSPVSRDGRRVKICANVGNLQEIDCARPGGLDGVGLFRTEFLLMERDRLPGEETQFEVYQAAVEAMEGKELIVRTFDIGGDKTVPCLALEPEENPFLGQRAIRLCLERRDIFRTQLRALLRASAYGNVKIMYPMIASLEELQEAELILDECRRELYRSGIPFKETVPVGMMIETPASVILAGAFAKRVDFFSIGTNDLTQYILAADRGNKKVSGLYDPLDPAVLHSISHVIEAGHEAGIPVGMCGELAGDPRAFPLLFGMGLDEFSMSAGSIPEVKRQLRTVTYKEARRLAERVLKANTRGEIGELLGQFSPLETEEA